MESQAMPATNTWTLKGPPTDKPVFSGLIFSAMVFSTLVKVYPIWTTEPVPASIWVIEP
jgi:hypothetical protein